MAVLTFSRPTSIHDIYTDRNIPLPKPPRGIKSNSIPSMWKRPSKSENVKGDSGNKCVTFGSEHAGPGYKASINTGELGGASAFPGIRGVCF